MTEIEQKALALVNEVFEERGRHLDSYINRTSNSYHEALCRAIEQHEAFKRQVSDAVGGVLACGIGGIVKERLSRFIIAKSDPLVEALNAVNPDVSHGEGDAELFREAIAARGGKIVWENQP